MENSSVFKCIWGGLDQDTVHICVHLPNNIISEVWLNNIKYLCNVSYLENSSNYWKLI